MELSPAWCVLFLKLYDEAYSKKGFIQRFYVAFNTGFEKTTSKYRNLVSFLIRQKAIPIGVLLIFIGSFVYLMDTTATGFVPGEDQGVIMSDVSLPAAAALERTAEVVKQIQEIVEEVPEVEAVFTSFGRGWINSKNCRR